MNNKRQAATSGIGMFGILCVISIVLGVLKCAKVIDWSWWIVLAPVLVYIMLVLTTLLIIGIICLGIFVYYAIKARRI